MSSNPNFFDVLVIGAGVAGSSTVYDLASAGFKVVGLEKEKLPRYKTCGGAVVLRAAKLLPLEITSVVQKEITAVDVYDQENKLKFFIKCESQIIYFVMRADLDNHILSKALDKGASVKDHTEVKSINIEADKVKIETADQTFTANFVVAADGATGFSMTYFRLNQNIVRAPAMESEIKVEEKTFNRFKDTARFDFGFVPHGYGWAFPKKDHFSVGVAFLKKVNQSIQDWFKKYLNLLEIHSENILDEQKHGYVIPLINGKVTSSKGRVLFAGDNLGFADPLTAEGISFAIETGRLAAKAIMENYNNHKDVIKNYSGSIDNVYKEIKAAKFLSQVVYGPLRLRKFIFKHYGKRLSELLADIITENKKYSQMVKDPVNYLKLFRPKYFFRKSDMLYYR